ncbi:beta-amylase [Klebsormidium nitens]|uniref:Beta-amylase n=1 Tax=Klebsormidium nitens TaxID=105231 RepID=A0A1Y1HMR9_KLENI|nr:beta-amylase [Klebsormidium nitens]|eukprot:GAQ79925.1 beta-amylase [Klebsormidium nitens]
MASAAVLSAPAPGSAKGSSQIPENAFLGGGANHSQISPPQLASQLSLEQKFAEEIRNRAEAAIAAANGGQTAVFIEPPPLFHSSREQVGLAESLLRKQMYIETDVTVDDTGVNAPLQTDVPVYVMLPLDTVRNDGFVNNPRAMEMAFRALKQAGCTGVMIDVWWGIAERNGPGQYDFGAYKHLLNMCKEAGLKMQAVMSFHACGGNVGDNVNISLPRWVLEAGQANPEIFYTDRQGHRNQECLSLFSDENPVLAGRTPLACYSDYMTAFRAAMGEDFGTVLTEVAVGMGPCGELRYPAYPEGDGRWRFPGVGEFQCYDKRALESLAQAAAAIGKPEWGKGGPHDAGGYNSLPHETGFFNNGGSWDTPYGRFFLEWYSQSLIKHGDRVMAAACKAFYGAESFEGPKRKQKQGEAKVSLKCAGIHWWYKSRSHGAELTAGYYNTRYRNGYAPIVELCQRYSADFNFTCVEMKDCEQPEFARCGPEELLKQVRVCAAQKGVPMAGENALSRLDDQAYEQILNTTCCTGIELDELDEEGQARKVKHVVPLMSALTFLRLSPQLLEERHFSRFVQFVRGMKEANGNKPLQVTHPNLVTIPAAQPAKV